MLRCYDLFIYIPPGGLARKGALSFKFNLFYCECPAAFGHGNPVADSRIIRSDHSPVMEDTAYPGLMSSVCRMDIIKMMRLLTILPGISPCSLRGENPLSKSFPSQLIQIHGLVPFALCIRFFISPSAGKGMDIRGDRARMISLSSLSSPAMRLSL